jgi:hypothetical protein
MPSKVTTHSTTANVNGKEVKVNFALRTTPKSEHPNVLLTDGIADAQDIHEVKIGEDQFMIEVGRTHVEQ